MTPHPPGPRPARVLIADDRRASLASLAWHIDAHPGLEVVGVAGDAGAALALGLRMLPDVAVLDARTPGLGAGPLPGTPAHGAPRPGIPVILMSAAPAEIFGAGCGAMGAVTALPRDADPDALLRAIARAGGAPRA